METNTKPVDDRKSKELRHRWYLLNRQSVICLQQEAENNLVNEILEELERLEQLWYRTGK